MAKKKKPASKGKKNTISTFFKSKQTHLVFSLFIILFAVFLLVSFVSFIMHWKEDQSELTLFTDRFAETKNLLGKTGAQLSHFFIIKVLAWQLLSFLYFYF